MCGRINQQDLKDKLFELADVAEQLPKTTNIGIGDVAVVQTMNETDKPSVELVKFGFNAGGRLNFNARAEGFHNKDNAPFYDGTLGIATNPFYKHLLNTKRCAIPVSSFIEGPEKEKLSKPFDIGFGGQLFWLGGVVGVDEKTGLTGFSIITTWPSLLIKDVVGHHRSPMMITDRDILMDWLNPECAFDDIANIVRHQNDDGLRIKELDPRYKSAKFYEPIAY